MAEVGLKKTLCVPALRVAGLYAMAGSVSLRNDAGARLELRLPASARRPSVSVLDQA